MSKQEKSVKNHFVKKQSNQDTFFQTKALIESFKQYHRQNNYTKIFKYQSNLPLILALLIVTTKLHCELALKCQICQQKRSQHQICSLQNIYHLLQKTELSCKDNNAKKLVKQKGDKPKLVSKKNKGRRSLCFNLKKEPLPCAFLIDYLSPWFVNQKNRSQLTLDPQYQSDRNQYAPKTQINLSYFKYQRNLNQLSQSQSNTLKNILKKNQSKNLVKNFQKISQVINKHKFQLLGGSGNQSKQYSSRINKREEQKEDDFISDNAISNEQSSNQQLVNENQLKKQLGQLFCLIQNEKESQNQKRIISDKNRLIKNQIESKNQKEMIIEHDYQNREYFSQVPAERSNQDINESISQDKKSNQSTPPSQQQRETINSEKSNNQQQEDKNQLLDQLQNSPIQNQIENQNQKEITIDKNSPFKNQIKIQNQIVINIDKQDQSCEYFNQVHVESCQKYESKKKISNQSTPLSQQQRETIKSEKSNNQQQDQKEVKKSLEQHFKIGQFIDKGGEAYIFKILEEEKAVRIMYLKNQDQYYQSKQEVYNIQHLQNEEYIINYDMSHLYENKKNKQKYIVHIMPLCKESLSQFLMKNDCELSFFFKLTSNLFHNLIQLRQAYIYHSDIKPGNILLIDNVILLSDFGSSQKIFFCNPFPKPIKYTREFMPKNQTINLPFYHDIYGTGITLNNTLENVKTSQDFKQKLKKFIGGLIEDNENSIKIDCFQLPKQFIDCIISEQDEETNKFLKEYLWELGKNLEINKKNKIFKYESELQYSQIVLQILDKKTLNLNNDEKSCQIKMKALLNISYIFLKRERYQNSIDFIGEALKNINQQNSLNNLLSLFNISIKLLIKLNKVDQFPQMIENLNQIINKCQQSEELNKLKVTISELKFRNQDNQEQVIQEFLTQFQEELKKINQDQNGRVIYKQITKYFKYLSDQKIYDQNIIKLIQNVDFCSQDYLKFDKIVALYLDQLLFKNHKSEIQFDKNQYEEIIELLLKIIIKYLKSKQDQPLKITIDQDIWKLYNIAQQLNKFILLKVPDSKKQDLKTLIRQYKDIIQKPLIYDKVDKFYGEQIKYNQIQQTHFKKQNLEQKDNNQQQNDNNYSKNQEYQQQNQIITYFENQDFTLQFVGSQQQFYKKISSFSSSIWCQQIIEKHFFKNNYGQINSLIIKDCYSSSKDALILKNQEQSFTIYLNQWTSESQIYNQLIFIIININIQKSFEIDLSKTGISQNEVAYNIANALKKSENITQIAFNLSGINISVKEIQSIISGLENFKLLTKLDLILSKNNICPKEVQSILSDLERCQLNELNLDLSQNNLETEGIQIIYTILEKQKKLTRLSINLSHYQLVDQEDEIIETDLKQSEYLDNNFTQLKDCSQISNKKMPLQNYQKLEVLNLNLNMNKITFKEIQRIVDILGKFLNLNKLELRLSKNDICSEGAKIIASLLETHGVNLTELTLDLSLNHINEEGAQSIANTFKNFTKLNKLDLNLGNNSIKAKGIEQIAIDLNELANLTNLHLNLCSNYIGTQEIKNITQALENFKNITKLSLDLSNTAIGAYEIKTIATVLGNYQLLNTLNLSFASEEKTCNKIIKILAKNLKECQQITELSLCLSKSEITLKEAKNIAGALKNWQQLTKLTIDLSKSNINDKEAKIIAEALQNYQKITQLNIKLSKNQISSQGAYDIAKSLRQLKLLKRLNIDLSNNKIGDDKEVEKSIKSALDKSVFLDEFNLNLERQKETVNKYQNQPQVNFAINWELLSMNDYINKLTREKVSNLKIEFRKFQNNESQTSQNEYIQIVVLQPINKNQQEQIQFSFQLK